MRGVVVLYNESLSTPVDNPDETIAEEAGVACAEAIAEALAATYAVAKVPICATGELELADYPPDQWVVFNLTEDPERRLFEHIRIPLALEAMGYRYTGNSPEALAQSTNKWLAKKRLIRSGIPTPQGWLFRHAGEVGDNYPFPLLVKPAAKDASLGLDDGALVHNIAALRQRVDYVVGQIHTAALAEQFIAGREFSVDIWGDPPEILPISEILFQGFPNGKEHFLTFASKWLPDTFEFHHTSGVCPAKISGALRHRLSDIVSRVWEAFECSGYTGADLRVDASGAPYVIDVNCNPDLSPDAGFYRAAHAAGYTYEKMARRIVEMVER